MKFNMTVLVLCWANCNVSPFIHHILTDTVRTLKSCLQMRTQRRRYERSVHGYTADEQNTFLMNTHLPHWIIISRNNGNAINSMYSIFIVILMSVWMVLMSFTYCSLMLLFYSVETTVCITDQRLCTAWLMLSEIWNCFSLTEIFVSYLDILKYNTTHFFLLNFIYIAQ